MTFFESSVNLYKISLGEPICKRIKYLALVSESKKTLENSARMIRADAKAGKRPT